MDTKRFSLDDLAADIRKRHGTPKIEDKVLAEIAMKKTLASKIVSVQPMAVDKGLLFWLDYKYGKNGSGKNGAFKKDEIPEIDIKIESKSVKTRTHRGGDSTQKMIDGIDKVVINDLLRASATKQVSRNKLNSEITNARNEIHRNTIRGLANFVVCHPEGHDFSCEPGMSIHMSKFMPSNTILIGHMGGNYLESGYVYGPYKRDGSTIHAARQVMDPKFYAVLEVV